MVIGVCVYVGTGPRVKPTTTCTCTCNVLKLPRRLGIPRSMPRTSLLKGMKVAKTRLDHSEEAVLVLRIEALALLGIEAGECLRHQCGATVGCIVFGVLRYGCKDGHMLE